MDPMELITVAARSDEYLTWGETCPCCGHAFVEGEKVFQSQDHQTYLHARCIEALYRILHPTDIETDYQQRRSALLNQFSAGTQWIQ